MTKKIVKLIAVTGVGVALSGCVSGTGTGPQLRGDEEIFLQKSKVLEPGISASAVGKGNKGFVFLTFDEPLPPKIILPQKYYTLSKAYAEDTFCASWKKGASAQNYKARGSVEATLRKQKTLKIAYICK